MTMRVHLPTSRGLEEHRWQPHHRLLTVILAAQIPALLAIALGQGRAPWVVAAVSAALVAALLLGSVARRRRIAMLAIALGLVTTSALLLWLTDAAVGARLHVFVVLGLLALYRDSHLSLSAVAAAGASQMGVELAVGPAQVSARVMIPGLFVLAAAVCHLLWRWLNEPAGGDAGRVARSGQGERQVRRGEQEQALIARIEEAERLKSELVAVVSHEFRTPLTSIMGFAQTLERRIDQMDRATIMTCLRSIEGQARRLERIVTNLLVVSEDVRFAPKETADLTSVTAAVLHELEEFPGPGTHRIVADIEPGLQARMGAAAAARILTNLLDNALKFAAPHTEIWLSGRRSGTQAVLEVVDQGTSIREDDLERIFDPFVQADSSDTRRAEGIGLGLAIVRRLVEAHGGRVSVRNDPPLVALVVSLPAAEPTPATMPACDPVGAHSG